MGLNIKGQLGQYHFDNMSVPTLVVSLLPFGKKNPRALSSGLPHTPKSPIVEILESIKYGIVRIRFAGEDRVTQRKNISAE